MKILIENTLSEEFKHFLEKDCDIDLFSYLIELLNKNDSIKLDSEYLNNYYDRDDITEQDVPKYKDDALFKELKDDMFNWVTEIQNIVNNIPGVISTTIKGSGQAGMSTYLTVTFKRPDENDPIAKEKLKDDPKFLTHYFSGFGQDGGYEGEYRLKFRISNHKPQRTYDTNVFMNILGHNFDWIKDTIIKVCTKRAKDLQNYWKDYCKTGRISKNQIRRNQDRKNQDFLTLEYMNKGYIPDKYMNLLKETFGKDRLHYMLDDNVLDYLDIVNVDLEDIIYEVEVAKQFKNYDYIRLLQAVANCLNQYVIEYTFDDEFNYELFLKDVQDVLSGKITSKPILV